MKTPTEIVHDLMDRDFLALELDGPAHDRAQKYVDALITELHSNGREFARSGEVTVLMSTVQPRHYRVWVNAHCIPAEPLAQVTSDVRAILAHDEARFEIAHDGAKMKLKRL